MLRNNFAASRTRYTCVHRFLNISLNTVISDCLHVGWFGLNWQQLETCFPGGNTQFTWALTNIIVMASTHYHSRLSVITSVIILLSAFFISSVHLHPLAEIIFEEDVTYSPADAKHEECWIKGQVYWPATDRCYQPAKRGPCSPGQWIILTGDSALSASNVQCKPIPCADKHILLENGSCHSVEDKSICPEGKAIATNPFGVADCVCKHGTFLWESDQFCYPLYRKGPCDIGHYLYFNNASAALECIANSCVEEDRIPYGAGCHKLGSSEPCADMMTLNVDLESLQLKCQNADLSLRQIAIAGYNCGTHSPMRYTKFCRPVWKFGWLIDECFVAHVHNWLNKIGFTLSWLVDNL